MQCNAPCCFRLVPSRTTCTPCSGELDISNPSAVSYVANIISEFASVVSDSFFHLGGDEVNMNCWSQAPTIKAYLSTHQNSSVHQLQQQYVNAIAQQALAAN